MKIEDDLARIADQEERLRFDKFDAATAWTLGSLLRDMAVERGLAVAIDVQLHAMPAFYCALPGTTADNTSWIRRKRAVAMRFFRSSYALGLVLAQQQTSIEAKFGLDSADYATHGGSFPIFVKGTGCIGAVTVSGLPQREDHNMVVEALCRLLDQDHNLLRLI
ncbi:heme-degrading domain-containing protein [Neorhizobium sp. T786]|uniref:heme-degrading domain-containing protein n=1 Tax=Pseudorhizobium xiangyangii TaxID=2883104 RepID=UPI001CFF564A|nr:heme-degrading domain-containing protein [Neorhizobium xiangyangii]MCB5201024.1 heme-degrading domain-containing protein [Neorhizobium xiangyangii]